MFGLRSWSSLQDRLLADPGYVGVMPGATRDAVALIWRVGCSPGEDALRVIAELHEASIPVVTSVSDVMPGQVVDERNRLSESPSAVEIYVVGPNEDETGLNIVLGKETLATAARSRVDLLAAIGPRVPVVLREGYRPIVA